MEIYSYFKKHLGPRSMSAGLRLRFDEGHGDPGLRFGADVSHEYQAAIGKGLEDGLSIRFSDSRNTVSIRVESTDEDHVDSSEMAFYLAARCAIEQAFVLTHVKLEDLKS